MGICNRDHDASEQKEILSWSSYGVVATGVSISIAKVKDQCTVQGIFVSSFGLSGAPQLTFNVQRFAAGATVMSLGISNMVVTTFGTSGSLGWSGLNVGSSLLQLVAGDVIALASSVANTSQEQLLVDIVVKKTQDVLAVYGSQT